MQVRLNQAAWGCLKLRRFCKIGRSPFLCRCVASILKRLRVLPGQPGRLSICTVSATAAWPSMKREGRSPFAIGRRTMKGPWPWICELPVGYQNLLALPASSMICTNFAASMKNVNSVQAAYTPEITFFQMKNPQTSPRASPTLMSLSSHQVRRSFSDKRKLRTMTGQCRVWDDKVKRKAHCNCVCTTQKRQRELASSMSMIISNCCERTRRLDATAIKVIRQEAAKYLNSHNIS